MKEQPGQRNLRADEHEWGTGSDGISYVVFSTKPGDPERPMTVLSEYPPNHREPAHMHGCAYTQIVVEGAIRVGKIEFGKGDVRITQAGVGYGPLVSGPNGCRVLTIFDRADGSPMRLLGKDAVRAADQA